MSRVKKLVLICASILLLSLVFNLLLAFILNHKEKQLDDLIVRIDYLEQEYNNLKENNNSLRTDVEVLRESSEINEKLLLENNNLRSTVKKLSYVEGVSRSGMGLDRVTPLNEVVLEEDLGSFKVSYYTPTVEECGSNSGITSSGKAVIGAYTCAADTTYWPYGTKFYVEGMGIVEVMDTGGAIKGRNRIDICLVTSREQALKMGIQYPNVWLVK